MENTIKEVQNYFKGKLLSGDFKIVKITEHTLLLRIDLMYDFTIWIGNDDIPNSRDLYDPSFIKLDLIQKERHKLHSILRKPVKEFKEKIIFLQKRKQFLKLQKELQQFESK
jgi:hypothetical protein